MTRLLIDLPDDLEAKLRERTIEGGYAGPQDYVRALIAADVSLHSNLPVPPKVSFATQPELENLLIEGMRSSPSAPITAADWETKRQQLIERYANPGSK